MFPLQFVNQLAAYSPAETIFNPYHHASPYHQLCRDNLQGYLEMMKARRPKLLLIGEALGYKGGRLTGIPFSSERILFEYRSIFPADQFQITSSLNPTSEQTATIVWNTLLSIDQMEQTSIQSEGARPASLPLMWNAFPFHPHLPNRPQSNRAPSVAEIKGCGLFIELLVENFKPLDLVAVGQKAAKSLKILDLPHELIRHPALGGKADFVKGLLKHL